MAKVTIVVATYNRPNLLKHTISSILQQTFRDWVLLVVGDACSVETEQQMEKYNDARIFYLNLPARCGEQSGPNSVGFFVAETEYVAFANHDDIWLPDHLERAIARLDRGDVDFYGAAAGLTTLALAENCPVFWERTPTGRQVSQAFFNTPVLFEPVSAWVVRRRVFDQVGPWLPARKTYRTPLENWILRVWRAGIACHFDDEVSVIYCNAEKTSWLRGGSAGSMYNLEVSEGAFWLDLLAKEGLLGFRTLVDEQISISGQAKDWTFFKPQYTSASQPWVFEALLTEETARLYKEYGWDGHAQATAILQGKPGEAMGLMLKRRTGEELPVHENWESVSRTAQALLNKSLRWRKMNSRA